MAACSRRSGAAYAGDRSALARGFAVASTDSGHQGAVFDGSFFRDQQATLNFLYQAVADVTVVAKRSSSVTTARPRARVLRRLLHRRPRGDDDVAAFPGLFDGIVAAAPAAHQLFEPRPAVRHAPLNAVAPRDAQGNPQTRAALSDTDRKLLIDECVCSLRRDSMATRRADIRAADCASIPATLACTGDKKEGCLSAGQVRRHPRGDAGTAHRGRAQVYPGYLLRHRHREHQGLPGILAGP
jgi:feruloyl esterase